MEFHFDVDLNPTMANIKLTQAIFIYNNVHVFKFIVPRSIKMQERTHTHTQESLQLELFWCQHLWNWAASLLKIFFLAQQFYVVRIFIKSYAIGNLNITEM